MVFSSRSWLVSSVARTACAALSPHVLLRANSALLAVFMLFQRADHTDNVYTILWAVVFGFATLNILSLAARRFEPNRRGLTFGELMAVLIVLLSIFLLGWELLSLLHIFPIELRR